MLANLDSGSVTVRPVRRTLVTRPASTTLENKDKVVALICSDHLIMTSELCTATGIEKPMVMAVINNLDTEKFAQWGC